MNFTKNNIFTQQSFSKILKSIFEKISSTLFSSNQQDPYINLYKDLVDLMKKVGNFVDENFSKNDFEIVEKLFSVKILFFVKFMFQRMYAVILSF